MNPPRPAPSAGATPAARDPAHLGDFSADRRLLLLMAMAAVVGAAGAGAAWALLRLIALATNLAYFHRLSFVTVAPWQSHLGLPSVLVPVAGCIVIGLMARYGSERIRGHGIPEALEAILIGGSRMQAKVAVLKPISSAISIGTGGPFGAEGPIIMTGGAFGSLFAQAFHLSNAERKTLLVAGAAAGMSATFGTPVAAILLAVELLLFEWKPRSFVPVATASIIAAALRPAMIGSGALFPLAQSAPLPAEGLLLAALLGVIAGLASGGLTQLVYGSEDLFEKLPIHWMWRPAIGGLVVGIGGLIAPHALGVGYDVIGDLLAGHFTAAAAIRLMLVKAVIWSIALGSGTSGGVLAPLLMMGAALGALFGGLAPVGDVPLWALIGAAAMMAGTMRSPLTGIVFALELTHDMGALAPLAAGCVVAHATTVLLLRRSILTEKVARRGHHIFREYAVDPFETMRVAEIMASPVETISAARPVGEVVEFFTDPVTPASHKSYPVVDDAGVAVGLVARADALRWTSQGWPTGATVGELVSDAPILSAFEDEPAGRLADRMAAANVGRAPILRRSDGALVGIVARRDLLRVRAAAARHDSERERVLGLPMTGTR
ncbi:MAG TPA: chloride channel protein [Caulobacteraceae bacterium]|nr:chloride channel protein [Caulobacteraceae bacterium]